MKDSLGILDQTMDQLSDEEFYNKFLKDQDWPQETEEDLLLDQMFREELDEDVRREEALQAAHPEITEVEPSPDLFDRILKKADGLDDGKADTRSSEGKTASEKEIQGYHPEDFLNEEDRKALEIGRKRMKNKKKRGWTIHFAATAAMLACVFLVGVGTEANRTRIVNVINTWVGNEALGRMNNETDREYVGKEQEKAWADIEEELGIKPVRFLYEVADMKFDRYEIDTKAKTARMFYLYKDTIFTIIMRQDEKGTAKGSIKDGDIKDTMDVETDIGTIEVDTIEGELGEKYMAEFVHNNTYYHIFGEIPKEEFVKLISFIFF